MIIEYLPAIIVLIFCYLGMGFLCSIATARFRGFIDRHDLAILIILNLLFWPLIVVFVLPFCLYFEYIERFLEKIVSFYKRFEKKN